METRLAALEFIQGDETAMVRFVKALDTLKNAQDRDNYARNVWLSGAYMHMAEALVVEHKLKAEELLNEAAKIIASDMRLKLRKDQLAKLIFSLSQS